MADWRGKVALVTGGSAGLGRAIARAFAERGASVVIAARGAEVLQAAAAALPGYPERVLGVPTDVRQANDVKRLIEATIARFGRLDVLVNNAGRSARGAAVDTTPEEFAELMDLNLVALVRVTREAMPHLLASRGHLVNIGSLAGKTAARYMGAYSTTKHAVSAYTQQLRLELAGKGLHVLLVSPGPIAREEPRVYSEEKVGGLPPSARKPGGGAKVGLLDPSRIAQRIVRACERNEIDLVMPGRARFVFALNQLWPRLGEWIVKKMS
jgi:NAD(P)-dependent dehydrogenase (short-subunit alcohol dehydrogenase family)